MPVRTQEYLHISAPAFLITWPVLERFGLISACSKKNWRIFHITTKQVKLSLVVAGFEKANHLKGPWAAITKFELNGWHVN